MLAVDRDLESGEDRPNRVREREVPPEELCTGEQQSDRLAAGGGLARDDQRSGIATAAEGAIAPRAFDDDLIYEERGPSGIRNLDSGIEACDMDQESFKKSVGEPNNFDELSARPEFQNLDTNISLLTQRIQRVEQDMQATKVLASQLTASKGQSTQQVINNI